MTASNSSVQLTLKALRKDSRFTLVEVVERFVSFPPPGHRSDLFGIIDVLAIGPGVTLAVQCCTKSGWSAHVKKIRDADAARRVLEAGWELQLHGWSKPKHRWECRVLKVELFGADHEYVVARLPLDDLEKFMLDQLKEEAHGQDQSSP